MTEVKYPRDLWEFKDENWEFRLFSLDEIKGVSQLNVRQKEPEAEIDELVSSFRELGINTMPIVLDEKNEVIAGNRRYRAAIKAGLKQVWAMKKPMSDREKRIRSMLENELQLPITNEDRYRFAKALRDDGLTIEQIAMVTGKSTSTISKWLSFGNLPETVIATGTADEFRKISGKKQKLVKQIIESKPIKDKPSVAIELIKESQSVTEPTLENFVKEVKAGVLDSYTEEKVTQILKKDKEAVTNKSNYMTYILRISNEQYNRIAHVAKLTYPKLSLEDAILTILDEWSRTKAKEIGLMI